MWWFVLKSFHVLFAMLYLGTGIGSAYTTSCGPSEVGICASLLFRSRNCHRRLAVHSKLRNRHASDGELPWC